MNKKITVTQHPPPEKPELEKDIDWLCKTLSFGAGRDTEKACSNVVKIIILLSKEQKNITSEDIAKKLNMSIQRVNYHIRGLEKSGFLYRHKRNIHIREGSVAGAVHEIRKDMERMFDKILHIGKEIDKQAGLTNRTII